MQNSAICLTFDYELFLGEDSGTVENCILKPTSLLLDLLEELHIRVTFFIDVLFYSKLLEQRDASRQAGLVREQLQRIVSLGSRIELHLHPLWLDAVFEEPSWRFRSYRQYSLATFNASQITEMFLIGTETLNVIAGEVETGYSCRAFRAGGFALPPFDRVIDAFRKSGIGVDSSVASGLLIEHPEYNVQYPVIDKDCYRFSTDPLKDNPDGEFIEVPISTRRISVIGKLVRRLTRPKEEPPIFGDGRGMSFRNDWKRRLQSSHRLLSLDQGGQDYLPDSAIWNKRLWTVISHPKSMNVASLGILRGLHDAGFRFITVDEACTSGS